MAKTKYTDDWFEMWHLDKEVILNTMVRNMTADLECGYDYFGKSITEQREAIEVYKEKFDADMLRRGVIEI